MWATEAGPISSRPSHPKTKAKPELGLPSGHAQPLGGRTPREKRTSRARAISKQRARGLLLRGLLRLLRSLLRFLSSHGLLSLLRLRGSFLLLLRHVPNRRLGLSHPRFRGCRLRRPTHPIAALRRS